ncbi:uncharacterized protein LOC116934718 [Daphnia magna]|uniref:Uncharacterized protein n=1 Tax=Daphnia magna TaxID=35525 RepID=A0ABQ9ZBV4_9CRUS|nr:uncharacterized protein LOC116934718 [Daphnia magna]XP_045028509.1 uncharacterized protein LOC116934718 [Daphnia magna]KAK4010396.1 hypothetical protein OUZ56_019539 [Daphnia magna]
MKLALILLSACMAISHQQYFRDPRMIFGFPWLVMPLTNNPEFYTDRSPSNEEHMYQGQLAPDGYNDVNKEEEEAFADTQSRIKGISRYRLRPYSNNNQQNARFFFNLLASTTTGAFTNPLLKTATFTSTQVLTLLGLVNCVPRNQVIAGASACRRKREDTGVSLQDEFDDSQFMVVPSKTLKLTPTALVSGDRSSDEEVWSSKDDVTSGEMSPADYISREKRFFFVNKNQFVVSSTITTFSFVNISTTATVNLLNPAPAPGAGNCRPAVGPCVNCLPAGFVLCPVPAG